MWAVVPWHWDSGVAGVPPAPGQRFGVTHITTVHPPAALPFLGRNGAGGTPPSPGEPRHPWGKGRAILVSQPSTQSLPHLGPLCHPRLGTLCPPPAPAAPRELLGPGAGAISPAALRPPCASLTFSMGMYCPWAQRYVYF